MEHHIKDIQGLIEYIRGLDIEHLKAVKDKQHDLILYTFESQSVEPSEELKQILVDDAYLSWLLFMRYDLDKLLGKEVDYTALLNGIKYLKKLWYGAKLRSNFEKTGERILVISTEDIDKEFPSVLFKSSENAPEQPIILSSMVIGMDYKYIIQTLARKNL